MLRLIFLEYLNIPISPFSTLFSTGFVTPIYADVVEDESVDPSSASGASATGLKPSDVYVSVRGGDAEGVYDQVGLVVLLFVCLFVLLFFVRLDIVRHLEI